MKILTFIPLFFLFQSLAQEYRDLTHNTFEGMTYLASFWNSTTPTSIANCSGIYSLQGSSAGLMYRVYQNLSTHSNVDLWLTIYVFGNWTIEDSININGYSLKGPIYQKANNSKCIGMSQTFGILEAPIQFTHNSSFLNLSIRSNISNGAGFSIRDIIFTLRQVTFSLQCIKIEGSLISNSASVCPNCQAHYYYNPPNCFPCQALCISCTYYGCSRCRSDAFLNQTSTGLVCASCLSTCSSCISSPSNCLSCQPGYYHLSNNSCVSTCPFTTAQNLVGGLDCYSPCNLPSVFLNGSCYSSCPPGFVAEYFDNAYYCTPMCNSTAFFYQGSCYQSCNFPLYSTYNTTFNLSVCVMISCLPGEKIMVDGTCQSTCPQGTTLNETDPNAPTCLGPCPLFQYYENGTCKSSCSSPFYAYTNLSTHVLYCILCNGTDGFLPDQTCINTCPNKTRNETINGLIYCIGPCSNTEYYFNGTCLNNCLPPYHKYKDPVNHIWVCTICDGPNNYSLPDYSCKTSCPANTSLTVKDELNFCLGVCQDLTSYLYQNGTCSANCSLPFKPYIDTVTKERKCKFCDNILHGMLPNSSCVPICPSSSLNTSYDGFIYCKPKCNPNEFLYKNDSCINTCIAPRKFYNDSDKINTMCSYCNGTSGLLPNNSCIAICPSNSINVTIHNETRCEPLCPTGEFLYRNNSCLGTCLSPYTPFWDKESINRLCYVCNGTSGLLPNGTCVSKCPDNSKNTTSFGEIFCEPLCQAGQYLYRNNTCLDYCSSPFTSFWDTRNINKLCYICNGTEGLIPNNTCVPKCPLNTVNTSIYGDIICLPMCSDALYLYNNLSCLDSCEKPYTSYNDGWNKRCSICNGTDSIMPNYSCVSSCPHNYSVLSLLRTGESYCLCSDPKYIYKDGSCKLECLSPFRSRKIEDLNVNLCEACPHSEYLHTNSTCSNYSCPAGQRVNFLYGEKICQELQSTSCLPGFYHFNSSCLDECPRNTGAYFNTTSLESSCFVKMQIISANQIPETLNVSLIFDETVSKVQMTKQFFKLIAKNSRVQLEFDLNKESESNWTVLIKPQNIILPIEIEINFTNELIIGEYDIFYKFTKNTTLKLVKSEETKPTPSTATPALSPAVASAFQAFSSSSMGVAAASAMVTGSTIGFKGQISMVQYLMSLLFLNVEYPNNLIDFLQIFKVARLQFIPNPFKWIISDLQTYSVESPFKFYLNQFEGTFVQNIGNILFVCSFFIAIHLTGLLILKLDKSSKLTNPIRTIIAEGGIPGMVSFLCGFSVIITISSTLQIISPEFSDRVYIFSWFFSLFFITGQFWAVYKIFKLHLQMSKNFKQIPEILDIHRNLFKDLKFNKNGVPKPYLAIVLTRDLVQFFLIVILYEWPAVQILSQMLLSFYLFVAVSIMQPFSSKIQNVMDVTRELSLTLIYVFIMIIRAHQDKRDLLGIFCIIFCSILVIIQLLGSIIILAQSIIAKIKKQKQKKLGSKDLKKRRILRKSTILKVK